MMKSKSALMLSAVVVGSCIVVSASADPVVVRFVEPDVTVGLGSTFSIDIVADIPDPVAGWGLDLAIDDATIASLVGAPVVGGSWSAGFAPDGDGLAGLAFPVGVSGTGVVLATVTFSADALGETDLFLSTTAGDLSEGFPFFPAPAPPLPGFAEVEFQAGHITVVPAPGAALLALIGAPLIGWTRRRFARR